MQTIKKDENYRELTSRGEKALKIISVKIYTKLNDGSAKFQIKV